MEIRPYTNDDIEAVVAVFRSNIPKYFGPGEEKGLREFLDSAERLEDYFVCELGNEIVGSGGVALNQDDTVSLCWGMIRSDHLGTGLGKELTLFRIAMADARYPGKAFVLDTSQHTSGFYEKQGFEVTELTKDGYGPGLDICKMRREAV